MSCAWDLVGTLLVDENTPVFFLSELSCYVLCFGSMTTNLFYFHQLSLYRAALCQHSGPDRLFPSGSDSIYGLGLFWCKED